MSKLVNSKNFQKLCSECNKTFTTKSNLKKHSKKFHPDKLNIIVPPKSFNYHCDICKKNFNLLNHWRHHQKKMHQITDGSQGVKTCPLCNVRMERSQLFGHFNDAHGITVETSTVEVPSMDQFFSWKQKIEKDTKSCFVKSSGLSKNVNRRTFWYNCHRSGHFVTSSRGLRNLKSQGSNKINGYCPAAMKVMLHDNGGCSVEFVETHVGHGGDLGHLTLTPAEREMVASKLAMKIPFNQVLAEIKATANESDLERIHLLTRKDLYNIEKSFNLDCLRGITHDELDSTEVILADTSDEMLIDTSGEHLVSGSEDVVNKYEGVLINENDVLINTSEESLINPVGEALMQPISIDNSEQIPDITESEQCEEIQIIFIDNELDSQFEESTVAIEEFCSLSLAKKKESLQNKVIPQLIEIIDSIRSEEELEVLEELMASIEPTLQYERQGAGLFDVRKRLHQLLERPL